MRVLVTGGGGFLGSYIVERLLARGDEVTVLCRSKQPWLDDKDVRIVRTDVADRAAAFSACLGQEVVFHVASRTGISGPKREYHATNVLGTQNVVDACVANGVRRLVYTSSPSVVLDTHHVRGGDESMPYPSRFLNEYQRTKAMAERYVLAANGREGLVTTSLRPHAIWGPRDNHLLPRLLDRARRGRLRIVGDGKNRVSMVYVENAADAHVLAATAAHVGGRAYFICDEEPVMIWDWVNELLVTLGFPPVTRRIPYGAAYALGAACDLIYGVLNLQDDPPMTRYVATELAKDHFFDTRRAREDLGFRAAISRSEGTLRMLAEYRRR